MATSAVAAAFTNPQNFYQQLVDRREYTKAAAEAEVTRLAGLTGDDAATEAHDESGSYCGNHRADSIGCKRKNAQAAFQSLGG